MVDGRSTIDYRLSTISVIAMNTIMMLFAGVGAGAILAALFVVVPVAVSGLIVGSILLMSGPLVDKLVPKLPRPLAAWLEGTKTS
jgi:hypothetical protein